MSRARRQFAVLALLFCILLSVQVGSTSSQTSSRSTLILVSIDAFRFDYLTKYQPPNLTTLAREGVQAKWMTPVFPALTFPNHYTIATGLYPEHHGIIANEIFDPVFKATFAPSNKPAVQDGRWWGGEPIWVRAERHGVRGACYFFPGSEAEILGVRSSYWKPYDESTPNSKRVDTALSWLDLPAAQRPSFVALYFSDVDTAGHHFSPSSPEVKRAIEEVDSAIGRLIKGLKQRDIYDHTNIIIVSDHGMAQVKPTDVVLLDQYFETRRAERIIWGDELTQIFPKMGEDAIIEQELSSGKMKHARCYLKGQIPTRFHYQNNRRIAPIICTPDEGWRIFEKDKFSDEVQSRRIPGHLIGAHGYDNALPTMRATFIAHGPAFKSGVVVEPFNNVDVYNIMTAVLSLKPAPNDGDPNTARSIVR